MALKLTVRLDNLLDSLLVNKRLSGLAGGQWREFWLGLGFFMLQRSGSLTGSEVVGRGLGFALAVYLMRHWGRLVVDNLVDLLVIRYVVLFKVWLARRGGKLVDGHDLWHVEVHSGRSSRWSPRRNTEDIGHCTKDE